MARFKVSDLLGFYVIVHRSGLVHSSFLFSINKPASTEPLGLPVTLGDELRFSQTTCLARGIATGVLEVGLLIIANCDAHPLEEASISSSATEPRLAWSA
jgi:hypothetical protein